MISGAGKNRAIRRIRTALDKPLRILGVWWCLAISVSSFLTMFLNAWFVHPLPLSPLDFGSIGTLFVAVLFVAYRPNVGFGKTFAFSIVTLVVFTVLSFVTAGEFFLDSDVFGSMYPALDIALLSIAAVLF
ncbi:hypothetical protein ACFFQF_23510 [Haladaptatus pallidirubidus]|uniref:GGDEF domain-containing protein n=1 Tax=Haladaptatus pallidirubidus TaxID=1008152 RepID=A0AAV3UNK1_9EURY|nr:hypothetical protein [Haladaptatus pallidirubidus]